MSTKSLNGFCAASRVFACPLRQARRAASARPFSGRAAFRCHYQTFAEAHFHCASQCAKNSATSDICLLRSSANDSYRDDVEGYNDLVIDAIHFLEHFSRLRVLSQTNRLITDPHSRYSGKSTGKQAPVDVQIYSDFTARFGRRSILGSKRMAITLCA